MGNQSRPQMFGLNIRRPPPLYLTVTEVGERVALVGNTSDSIAEEHAVESDDEGRVVRGCRDGVTDAEGLGGIVRGSSGEAVRILKTPGSYPSTLYSRDSSS